MFLFPGDYEPSVGALVKALLPLWGKENSDPAKVAQVVLRLADSQQLPPHLLLGSDAVRYADVVGKTLECLVSRRILIAQKELL